MAMLRAAMTVLHTAMARLRPSVIPAVRHGMLGMCSMENPRPGGGGRLNGHFLMVVFKNNETA